MATVIMSEIEDEQEDSILDTFCHPNDPQTGENFGDKSTQTESQDEMEERDTSEFVDMLKNQAAVVSKPLVSFKDVVRSRIAAQRQKRFKQGANFCWYVMFTTFTVIGLMHMYFLLYTFFVEPTNISMELKIQSRFSMPRIHVCSRLTRFLDPEKLRHSNVTAEQFFALEVGSGYVGDSNEKWPQKFQTLDLRQMSIEYWNYIKLNDGSIIRAYKNFHSLYGLRCEQIFGLCLLIPGVKHLNCCDIFELVYTLNGPCYVSRENAVNVTTVQAVGSFRFRLKYQAPVNFVHLETDLKLTGYYAVGVFDDLVQTWHGYWPNKFTLANTEVLDVNAQQRRREMLKIPNRCIGDKRGVLRHFKEYSIANCFAEKQVLDKLHLLNNGVQCVLPYSQLMNPSFKTGKHKLCTLADIFHIYSYRILHAQFINGDVLSQNSTELLEQKCRLVQNSSEATVEDLWVLSPDSLADKRPPCTAQFVIDHFDHLPSDVQMHADPVPNFKKYTWDRSMYYEGFLDLLSKTCNSYNRTGSSKPNCTRSALMKSAISYDHKLALRAQRNSDPIRLINRFGRLQDSEPGCLPLCETNIHQIRFHSFVSKAWTGRTNSEVNIRFVSSEVEISQEVNRLDWSEYVSLIGGNIGMWNGWCALSLINLFALFARRFIPFAADHR